jgi:hypothetical protein
MSEGGRDRQKERERKGEEKERERERERARAISPMILTAVIPLAWKLILEFNEK